MVSREQLKKKGFRRFIDSFKYSFQGLIVAYRDEQSMWIHLMATVFSVALGFYFKISAIEWIFVIILILLVLGSELLNTAIEAIVDLVSPEYHDLAKKAKDLGSAAVFVFSMLAIAGGGIIFVPKIIELIS